MVKVKEPLAAERKRLRRGQVLFTYLHLAPDLAQTRDLMASGATCIAYETVTSPTGGLPLLTPMSEVAGRLAPQVGANCLERAQGGRGVLLGGVPGVPPAEVIILGGGVSGTHAATIALGMGAAVTVVDRSADALRRLTAQFGARIAHGFLDPRRHRAAGAARRPVDRSRSRARRRGPETDQPRHGQGDEAWRGHRRHRDRPGRMLGDLAPDDAFGADLYGGGRRSLLRHQYAGRGARTSTFALNNVTLPFTLALADKGWKQALRDDPHLRDGLNVHDGQVFCGPVAEAHGLPAARFEDALDG